MLWKRRAWDTVSRSVFSISGWVRRNLTEDELLDVYDVGVGDRKVMRQALSEGNMRDFPLEVTQQQPVRVLLRCLEVLTTHVYEKMQVLPLAQEQGVNGKGDYEILELEQVVIARETMKNKTILQLGISDQEKQQTKNDDAAVRISNWNRRVCDRLGYTYDAELHDSALDKIRHLQLRWYRHFKHGVIGSFRKYMVKEYGDDWMKEMQRVRRRKGETHIGDREIIKDYDVGIDAIRRALGASFWEWDDGSTILFWRWPDTHRQELRDGLKVWFRRVDLPKFWGKQKWPDDKTQGDQLKDKLTKVVNRRYIVPGFVKSLTSFFAVPKGTDDIRIVYDATKSGLNNAIWTPNFCLPTMVSVLNNADDKTFYGDIDIGEMFLNYFLDPELRPWAGVDVTGLNSLTSNQEDMHHHGKRLIMRWDRSLMGVRSSPYNCVRAYLISEEIIKGDRRAPENPFRWHRVVFNMPGTQGYDPAKPWMFRFDDVGQNMAAFVLSYVDDLRTGSNSGLRGCEQVTHVTASKLNYLGEQDAARKRGEASQTPGAWAGSVIVSKEDEGLYVSVSQEKWDKVRKIVEGYQVLLMRSDQNEEDVMLDHKQLERDTGFLVHVFMTYDNLRPYLKGFYLTLNEWRFDRRKDGWKLERKDWEELAEEHFQEGVDWKDWQAIGKQSQDTDRPGKVKAVPRFREDIKVLALMFQGQTPSLRLVRGFNIARLVYGFGDASGAGFGASWVDCNVGQDENRMVHYRFGRWGDEMGGESSNFRELNNLVDTLAEMAKRDELSGVEVFLFTDNSTAEAAFYRGSSSNKKLYSLVKRLKLLEMVHDTRIHIIHIAGKRMIVQGTDGLSRGCLTDGVMAGEVMTSFVPLHHTAVERCRELLPWLQGALGSGEDRELELLAPEDWFEKGHDIVGGNPNCDGVWLPVYGYGRYVWCPPPCVASQCLEELRKARHKRQRSTHIFVCPRVMAYTWQRQLFRSADIVLQIPAGHPAWPESQHESLIVGFYFPFLSHEPWQLKGSNTILGMARRLQQVCKANPSTSGLVLRELWDFTSKLPNLPEFVVRRMLRGSQSFGVPNAAPGK